MNWHTILMSGIFSLSFLSQPALSVGAEEEDLTDLTAGVVPLIYEQFDSLAMGGELSSRETGLTSRSDLRYVVRVRNQTDDPIIASSLIVIVDKIIELARGRIVTDQLEVRGQDGYTRDGKPYFRVPVGDGSELAPFAESQSLVIRILNPDLLRISPPRLRVKGIPKNDKRAINRLRDTLIQKGILSPEEAGKIFEQTPEPQP